MRENWAMQHRISSPQDGKELVSAVLEARQQLQRLLWWRHKSTKIEQGNSVRAINVTKEEMLGEGTYADFQ